MKEFIEETINNWEEDPKEKLFKEIQEIEDRIKEIDKILEKIDEVGLPEGINLENLEKEYQNLVSKLKKLTEREN